MADDPSQMLADYFKKLIAEHEKRTKEIQDQLEQQWKTNQKAVADLLDQHLKAQKKAFEHAQKTLDQMLRQPIAPGHPKAPPPRR